MNGKNVEAMGRGREYMLARFANLPLPGSITPKFLEQPSGDLATAEKALCEFRSEFGELGPEITGDKWYVYLITFRYQWYWRQANRNPEHRRPLSISIHLRGKKRRLSINEMDDASAWATSILNRNNLDVEVDFPSGRINLRPNTLIDWLVLSLIECRRKLTICANGSCRKPYFVKTHPRDRYCCKDCSDMGRQVGQQRWEQANRSAGAKRCRNRKKS